MVWMALIGFDKMAAHIFNGIFNESLFPLNSVRITGERVRRVVSKEIKKNYYRRKTTFWGGFDEGPE